MAAIPPVQLTHHPDNLQTLCERGVGKIQPHNIQSRAHHPAQDGQRAARRPYRRYDLCLDHCHINSRSKPHRNNILTFIAKNAVTALLKDLVGSFKDLLPAFRVHGKIHPQPRRFLS
jgi:hypothetical protein